MAQLVAKVTIVQAATGVHGFLRLSFSESDIGLRHKHSLSCLFTVSRLLLLGANSCGHCLDMPVEDGLVGYMQTVYIGALRENSCSTGLKLSFTPSTV